MTLRKITSLTALLTFIVVAVTSIILYIVPQGRVAYWADWELWGLSKTQWGDIHINAGVLFLIAIGLHVYYNWKPLTAYLKDKAKHFKIFTADFNAALVVTIVLVIGTLLHAPPFGWVLDLNTYFQDAGALKYGEPPYGHAELSTLKTFMQRLELTPAETVQRLQDAGIAVTDSDQTILEIAHGNGLTPKAVYEAMKPPAVEGAVKSPPKNPPPGTGARTLADLCAEFDLHPPAMVRALADENIEAAPDQTIREIAQANGVGPLDVYTVIRNAAGKNG